MPDAYMPDPNYPPSSYSGGYSGPAQSQPNTSPDSYYGTYGSQQLAQPTVPAMPPSAYPPLAPIPAPSSVPMIAPHMQPGVQMGAYPATVPTHDKGGVPAFASLVLGIFAVAVGWLPLCGIVALAPAIIAIVLGGVGLQSRNRRGLAVAGIVLGIAGVALALTLAI